MMIIFKITGSLDQQRLLIQLLHLLNLSLNPLHPHFLIQTLLPQLRLGQRRNNMAKLNDLAVTTTKIADLNVTTAKLAAGAATNS